MVGLALLAILGAVMLEKHSVLSGGGPPRGCPLITTASPERTYKKISLEIKNSTGTNSSLSKESLSMTDYTIEFLVHVCH